MKVAYFTDFFLPAINGIVTSILNVSAGLIERGHEVTIYAPKSKINPDHIPKKLRVQLIPSMDSYIYPQWRFALPMTPAMLMSIKNDKPDILHFHTPFLVGGASIALAKMFKIPILGTFHTYFMEPEYLKNVGLEDISILRKFLWKYAVTFYNQCDAVVVPGSDVIDDLRKNGIDKPMVIVPNTINERAIVKVPAEQVQKLRKMLHLNGKVLLYVGRLSPEKNIDVLLNGFKQTLKDIPDTNLVIVGSGPEEKNLKKLAKQHSLGSHVMFTGHIPQHQLLRNGYYQMADCFVTASTSETQAITFIEAMYFGLPIIAPEKRGVAEMIKDGGILTRPFDVEDLSINMVKLLSDAELLARLRKKSVDRYTHAFAFDTIINTVEDLYLKLISQYQS